MKGSLGINVYFFLQKLLDDPFLIYDDKMKKPKIGWQGVAVIVSVPIKTNMVMVIPQSW